MIFDKLINAERYAGTAISRALKALPEYAGKAPGRYEIDGENLFILVQHYESRPYEISVWETHKKYADVQYVAAGRERMGFADALALAVTSPYEDARDAELYANNGEGAMLPCAEGAFAVFFPGEAHMPCVADGAPAPVVKLVAKVRLVEGR